MIASIWPSASGWVENSTVLTLTWLALMPLTFRNAVQIGMLVSEIPIVLPIMSFGVLIGLLAFEIMHVGDFWNAAPMMVSGAPLTIAWAPSAVCVTPTSALPLATTGSGATFGPPGNTVT